MFHEPQKMKEARQTSCQIKSLYSEASPVALKSAPYFHNLIGQILHPLSPLSSHLRAFLSALRMRSQFDLLGELFVILLYVPSRLLTSLSNVPWFTPTHVSLIVLALHYVFALSKEFNLKLNWKLNLKITQVSHILKWNC